MFLYITQPLPNIFLSNDYLEMAFYTKYFVKPYSINVVSTFS